MTNEQWCSRKHIILKIDGKHYLPTNVIFQKQIESLHYVELEMYNVMLLVPCNLGATGTSWIGPGKWVNIKDL